ncbi:MAG TPA: sensor domain-containing diguanylate cyclase, partial [Herpetosiphonaceae bacterium]
IDEQGRARIVRTHGYESADESLIRELVFEVAETANLRAMCASREPLAIPETASYPGWIHIEHVSARSYLGAPLISDGQVIGFINLDSPTPGFYRQPQARQLQAFAAQAALAFDNARLYAAMKTAADTDSLTGLATRRHWYAAASAAYEHAGAAREPLALLMIDIDEFKGINDTYGHAAGDRVIRSVAGQIRAALREGDLIGRYGGEEYVGLLPATGLAAAALVAERLRQLVEAEPIAIEGRELAVTISVGVAERRNADPSLDALLTSADSALYAAKRGGRNLVRLAGGGDPLDDGLG